jgi:hypothetical protein
MTAGWREGRRCPPALVVTQKAKSPGPLTKTKRERALGYKISQIVERGIPMGAKQTISSDETFAQSRRSSIGSPGSAGRGRYLSQLGARDVHESRFRIPHPCSGEGHTWEAEKGEGIVVSLDGAIRTAIMLQITEAERRQVQTAGPGAQFSSGLRRLR